jgi:hypothetical protein
MQALDRDALYYPYIHIRDVNWLKTTLLCFPGVRRMVPQGVTPNDSEDVKPFLDCPGPRNRPLLSPAETLETGQTVASLNRLKSFLSNHEEEICRKFSKAKTLQEHPDEASRYTVHDEKISSDLIWYLEEKQLAWRPDESDPHWLAFHPAMARAVLSVTAIAVAHNEGLDIVTPSENAHYGVIRGGEEGVYQSLLDQPASPVTVDTVDRLAEVFMFSVFDVTALSAQDISNLLNDGKDLRLFKQEIAKLAAEIPVIGDDVILQRRLQDASREIADKWKKYQGSLPGFAVKALVDVSNLKISDLAISLIAGEPILRIPAHPDIGTGLAVMFLVYSGVRIYRAFLDHKSNPYSYLSEIQKAGACIRAPSVVPQSVLR